METNNMKLFDNLSKNYGIEKEDSILFDYFKWINIIFQKIYFYIK